MYRRDILKGILSLPFILQFKLKKEGDDDLLIRLANKGPVYNRKFILTKSLYMKPHWIFRHCTFQFINKNPNVNVSRGTHLCCFFGPRYSELT